MFNRYYLILLFLRGELNLICANKNEFLRVAVRNSSDLDIYIYLFIIFLCVVPFFRRMFRQQSRGCLNILRQSFVCELGYYII